MKTNFFYSFILVLGLTFSVSSFANVSGQTPKKTETKAHPMKYTCPEHPEVVMNKPGKCPKCGMALVEKKEMKEKKDMKKGKMLNKKESPKMKEMPMK